MAHEFRSRSYIQREEAERHQRYAGNFLYRGGFEIPRNLTPTLSVESLQPTPIILQEANGTVVPQASVDTTFWPSASFPLEIVECVGVGVAVG